MVVVSHYGSGFSTRVFDSSNVTFLEKMMYRYGMVWYGMVWYGMVLYGGGGQPFWNGVGCSQGVIERTCVNGG